jgi:outer membrane protein assembly factor BamB
LNLAEREVGDRVVCELQGGAEGGGRIFAYGSDDKIRWQFDNVAGPIDVQLQPNGRMLLAEINTNRVTERDRTGKILWEKKTDAAPMTCQRLSNGNVFIATYTELLEVAPDGKTAWSHKKPTVKIYCAQKLRNGHVLYVISGGLVIELDEEGKEIRSVPAGDTSNWGSVELLPNGHFLVCRCGRHEVVEIDAAGKEVWRCQAEWPTWAYQRRNGRVLVACAHSGQVIEFDRDGKEVWKQKLTGRPSRVRLY